MDANAGHVVVAGGGLAAARAIQQLRRRGHEGPITLLGAEAHLPYDRPPLSKAVLRGECREHDAALRRRSARRHHHARHAGSPPRPPLACALGDVIARWPPRYRQLLGIQHWDSAAVSAGPAAANTLAQEADTMVPHDPVPCFWSDQLGHKIQYVGHHVGGDRPVWEPAAGSPGASATWLDESGSATAVLTVDRRRESAHAQQRLTPGRQPE